jgi:hypothetical protein
MYSQKFVVAVKHNGRVLREHGDTVLIPFGSEYSLFFKNFNTLRAMVRVSVDGQDATEGVSLIVPANGAADLERFIKKGNLNQGNRFKFIKRTAAIENGPRGIQAEDGIIRVEFEFERQPDKIVYETIKRTYIDDWDRFITPWYCHHTGGVSVCSTSGTSNDLQSGGLGTSDISNIKLGSETPCGLGDVTVVCSASATCNSSSIPQNCETFAGNVGITVPGSVSEQQFSSGTWFVTDGQKHVIVLRLAGRVGERFVKQAVTVKAKPRCVTCGHKNKATAKFCSECGTVLEIV